MPRLPGKLLPLFSISELKDDKDAPLYRAIGLFCPSCFVASSVLIIKITDNCGKFALIKHCSWFSAKTFSVIQR